LFRLPCRNRRRAEPPELHDRGTRRHADLPPDRGTADRSDGRMTVELAIIGAGPAGMAAAVLAGELGLDTVLVDEQSSPGGQIYRAIERAAPDTPLGPDYLAGRPLAAALRASRVDYRPNSTLWHLDTDGTLFLENAGRTETVTARRVLLETGYIVCPVPIPGWSIPVIITSVAAKPRFR